MTTPYAQQHYRWNFRWWVTETAAWMMAVAFIDSTTVLPTLVVALSGSPLLASLILSIRYIGQGWPQLIAASKVSGSSHRKEFYVKVVIPGRLLLLLPAFLLVLGITTPGIAVTGILLAYLAFWVSEGFSIVPWVDILGKTIPPMRRGRLFATMHIVGGLLGIGAGLVVRYLLQSVRFPFPHGYGVLFFLAFLGAAFSTVSVAMLREPHSPPEEERYSTKALIKDIPNLLRAMPVFRRLVVLQGLFGFAFLPAPLYILYVSGFLRRVLPIEAGEESLGVGTFLAVQTAGMIFGNAVLGHLGDSYGNRLLLRVLAVLHVLVPVSAVIAGFLAPGKPGWMLYLLFAPTFFIYGTLFSGTWMGMTNYLLEIAPAHDRPAYIAVLNALNLPAIFLPMVGGLLVRPLGYPVVFLLAAIFLSYAVYISGTLIEPREHYHPAHHE